MRIIEGFQPARLALTRQPLAELYSVSPAVKQRLNEIFGAGVDPEQAVRQIISEVRLRGDAALLDYTAKIDGIKLISLEVSREQMASRSLRSAFAACKAPAKAALSGSK